MKNHFWNLRHFEDNFKLILVIHVFSFVTIMPCNSNQTLLNDCENEAKLRSEF